MWKSGWLGAGINIIINVLVIIISVILFFRLYPSWWSFGLIILAVFWLIKLISFVLALIKNREEIDQKPEGHDNDRY